MKGYTLVLLGLFLLATSRTASQSINTLPAANKNQVASPNPTPRATPAATLSECAEKRTYGLAKGINIPQELCVDETKPIDKSERVNVPSGNNAAYSQIEETDVPFERLPPEVRRIIKLTAPDTDTNALLFSMTMLPVYDEVSKRFVKSYIYDSFDKDKESKSGANFTSVTFKRQNRLLKLDSAQFKFPPVVESSYLDKFTFMCSRSRAYTTERAGFPLPNVPLELCFDDKRSVDRSEIVSKKEAAATEMFLKEEDNIAFENLPAEVQKIIRLTTGEKYVNEKFHLDVMIDFTDEEGNYARKKTKDYLYHPGKEIKDNPSWAFKRQDNVLKLTQASLAIQK